MVTRLNVTLLLQYSSTALAFLLHWSVGSGVVIWQVPHLPYSTQNEPHQCSVNWEWMKLSTHFTGAGIPSCHITDQLYDKGLVGAECCVVVLSVGPSSPDQEGRMSNDGGRYHLESNCLSGRLKPRVVFGIVYSYLGRALVRERNVRRRIAREWG